MNWGGVERRCRLFANSPRSRTRLCRPQGLLVLTSALRSSGRKDASERHWVNLAMSDVLGSCWWHLLLGLGSGLSALTSAHYIIPNPFSDV